MARKDEYVDKVGRAIGGKIRDQRMSLGLSRGQFASLIKVTHQQLHKYENGVNRISAGRLALIARALNKPITFFYENLDNEQTETPISQRLCLQLTRHLGKINLPQLRAITKLAQAMAAGADGSASTASSTETKKRGKKIETLETEKINIKKA